ncbi:hypothetical protein VNO77_03322 [Canavalia gladiata]|uniref:Uncharacterized protein n=1 Tax=Canavalia gladiata TaxID=3824 RepID=A0AAN9MZG8_CANGL
MAMLRLGVWDDSIQSVYPSCSVAYDYGCSIILLFKEMGGVMRFGVLGWKGHCRNSVIYKVPSVDDSRKNTRTFSSEERENLMALPSVQLSILKEVVLYYACSCNMSAPNLIVEGPFYTMPYSVAMLRLSGCS